MVFILLIITVTIFLLIDWLVSRKQENSVTLTRVRKKESIPAQVIERYLHPGHSWAVVEKPQLVTVGVDDFVQRVLGHLQKIVISSPGSVVRQGEPLVTLQHGGRSITQVAPISGTISDVNQKLVEHPSLVNESPYERGWIAKIVPSNLRHDLANLMKGVSADGWQEVTRLQLVNWFAPRLGTVMQDGGQLLENLSDLLTDEDWHKLVHEFFPCVGFQHDPSSIGIKG